MKKLPLFELSATRLLIRQIPRGEVWLQTDTEAAATAERSSVRRALRYETVVTSLPPSFSDKAQQRRPIGLTSL